MLYQGTLDATKAGEQVTFSVGPFASATVQVSKKSGSTTGATYTVQRSVDGHTFSGFPYPMVITGSGMTSRLDIRAVVYLRVAVTTADATSPAFADIAISCD